MRLIIIDDVAGLSIAGGYDTSISVQRTALNLATFTFSETNRRLQVEGVSSLSGYQGRAYQERSAGKFYFEIEIIGSGNSTVIGWYATATTSTDDINSSANRSNGAFDLIPSTGAWNVGNSVHSGSLTNTGNRIYMFAVDWTAGKLWIGSNGTWQGSGDPGAGTGELCSGFSFGAGSPGTSQRGGFGIADARMKTATADLTYSIPTGFVAYSTE